MLTRRQLMVASSLVVLPLGCDDDEAPGSGKPLIISSIFPIHDLVRQVAGDGFACEAILTPGQSAHDFQPSPKLAKTVARAKAAMVVGLELDPWAKKLAEAAGGVKVTELGASADPKTFEVDRLGGHGHGDEHDHGKGHDHDDHDHGDHGHGDHGHGDHGRDKGHDHAKGHDDHGHDDHGRGKAHDHDEGHDHDKAHGHDHEEHGSASHGDHGHDHGGPDPHVWLSVPRAKKLVTAISAALATADPAQKAAVETNAGKVQLELDALHGEIGKKIAGFKKKSIVTFHGSFNYFAADYGLRVVAVIEPYPGKQPSAAYLKDVLQALDGKPVGALFTEPQLDARPAQVLAKEASLPLKELDPLGGGPGRDSYAALMRFNVEQLASVLA